MSRENGWPWVGTKVHGFLALSKVAYVANGFYSFSCKLGKFSPNRILKSKLFFFLKNRSLFLDTFERKLGALISLDLERKLGALISSSDSLSIEFTFNLSL